VNENTEHLLRLGTALYQMGIKLESTRRRILSYVSAGVSFEAEEMKQLVREYQLLQSQFESLEARYRQVKKVETKTI